jgi:sugar lactone lactonase YvrE
MIRKLFITASIIAMVYQADAQKNTAQLLQVVSFGDYQPIGVKLAPATNRLFVSFPHHEPFLYGLTELVNGQPVPYPDTAWNEYKPDELDSHFVNVQDLYTDDRNFLWVLDSAPAGGAAVIGNSTSSTGKFKLIKIDLSDNTVKRSYTFDDLPKDKSALNDVRVDNSKHLAYLSDPGLHAIVVLDLVSGKSRVVLKDDKSTIIEPGFVLHLDDKDVADLNGKPFTSAVNGIALTADDKYFYFRAINQTKLYRILTIYLADANISPADLSSKVEMVAETGVCHGMIADKKGNIYLSDSPDHAIQYVTPDGKVHMLVKDERIIWPDSFGIGNDGYLYFSCSQMNRLPKYNNGKDMVEYPFRVFKVKMP